MRRKTIVPWAVVLMLFGLQLISIPAVRRDSRDFGSILVAEAARGSREFVGLPLVRKSSTLVVQTMPGSAPVDMSMAYSPVAGGGSAVTTNATVLPETTQRFTAPAEAEEYSGVLSVPQQASASSDLYQGVTYELSDDLGNDAYLAQGLATPGAAAQARIRRVAAPPTYNCPRFTYCLFLPFAVRFSHGWTTVFSIQNLGTSFANTVVTVYDQHGQTATSFAIQPLQSHEIRRIDLDTVQELPDDFVGSAVVIADQPLAIASARTSNAGRGLSGSYTGIPASDAAPNLVAPALFKAHDLQTSELCLQDASGVGQTVVVSYTDSLTASVALPPAGARCLDQGQEGHAAAWSGGAKIASQSGHLVAAVVNITSWYGITPIGRWSYSVPGQFSISTVLALPLLALPPARLAPADWLSRIYLFNPNDTPAAVTLRYVPAVQGLPCGVALTIPARSTGTIVPATPPAGTTLAGFITSSQPLAGAIGFTSTKPLDATDRHFGYGAGYPYNPPSPTTPCTPVPASSGGAAMQRDRRVDAPRAAAIDPATGPPDREFVYQPYYFDIGATTMWGRGLTGGNSNNPITVAVIDTGVDLNHPDLKDNLVPGHDFVFNTDQPQDEAWDSHGTMVAGVIAARINNGVGVAGIGGGDTQASTPGIRIMPLRIARNLDPPPTPAEDIPCQRVADAIDYAVAHGARVINMSFETSVQCPAELASIQRAYRQGVALVAGAGNDRGDAPVYPAAYEDDGANPHNRNLVIAVAGVYLTGVKALTSNYGPWVDVTAPFRRIRSTAKSGSYASDDGTSYSAAFVSGLLAVLMSNNGWARDQAIAVVLGTASSTDDANPAYRGLLGAGRIDAGRSSALTHKIYLPLARRS